MPLAILWARFSLTWNGILKLACASKRGFRARIPEHPQS